MSRDSREHDDGVVAQRRHGFKGRVARPLDCPFIVLFEEDGADQPGDGSFIGEDADDVGAPFDFAVEPFDRIVAVDLGAVFLGEGHVGQDIGFGLVHQGCQLGDLCPDLISNRAPLLTGSFRRFLGECSRDKGGDDTASALAGMGQRIAHEVNPASLPAGTQQFGDSGPDTFMRIGDHQLDPAQAPAGQLSYERGPESLSFRRADIHAENFALAVGVDAHRNDHGHRDDPASLPDFDLVASDPRPSLAAGHYPPLVSHPDLVRSGYDRGGLNG